MIVLEIPIRTVSETNMREHWAARHRRRKWQREIATLAVRPRGRGLGLPLSVLLTRIAPRALDDDNLRGALKAIRDGVADALGVRDDDPRVVWRYAQRRGGKGAYAVAIDLTPVTLAEDTKRVPEAS